MAAARIIVSAGTFTSQPCRRLSQTRRDRRPRDTGPWFAAGITLFGYALSGSVALAGFGLDSLIEIGSSTVVLWELSGSGRSGRACLKGLTIFNCGSY